SVEQRVLVHTVPCIAARIAHDPGSVEHIVEAVVGMPVYPKARASSIDQTFGIGNEARIQQRIGESRMDALSRWSMVGDYDGRPVMRFGQLACEPFGVDIE